MTLHAHQKKKKGVTSIAESGLFLLDYFWYYSLAKRLIIVDVIGCPQRVLISID